MTIRRFLSENAGFLSMIGFCLFVGPPLTQRAGAEERAPSAQEIVDRAVNRAEAQRRSLVDATFESKVFMSVKSLDSKGAVVKDETTRYRQHPVAGALFEEAIEKNGRGLTEDEKEDEQKSRRKFIKEVAKRTQKGLHPQPLKRPGVQFDRQLMQRYRSKLLRTESVGGRQCWVIAFEPKPGPLPVDEMMDRALNQSTGTLWVVQEDYGLARLDFVMREPFKYWGGLLAVIRNTEGRLDFERVAPNVWTPSRFELKLDLNIAMVKDIRRLILKTWTDYRPAQKPEVVSSGH